MDSVLAWSLLVALAGGLVRGTTGFGGAMVMCPPLALLIGAQAAVPVTLLLETFAGAPMLRAASTVARWRVIAPIFITAALAIPAGAWLLAGESPLALRRAIAATVIVFSLALLTGYRYRGAPRASTSLGLGALSGVLLGATSIGAPPVILYLLSGPDPAAVTRANLTLYVALISVAGLVWLGVAGLLNGRSAMLAAQMAPAYVIGLLAGTKVFAQFSDRRFRQAAMLTMLVIALGVLAA